MSITYWADIIGISVVGNVVKMEFVSENTQQCVVVVSIEEFLDFLSNMSSDGWKKTLQKGKNING